VKRPLSLRSLLLCLTGIAIVVVTLSGLAIDLHERSFAATQRLSEQSARRAEAAVPLLLDSIVTGDLARATRVLETLNEDQTWSAVTLYDGPGGRVLVDATPSRAQPAPVPAWVRSLLPVRVQSHHVPLEAGPVVAGTLVVTPSLESLEAERWKEIRAMLAVTGALLATLLCLVHVILARGLHPIRILGETAARFGQGDLSVRMPETRFREVSTTVQAFNSMADSLERALHEARTHQRRLEALLEVSGELARDQSLPSVLARIGDACCRLVSTDSVGFRLVEGDELVVVGTGGDGREVLLTPRLRIGQSLSGVVAATGQPLLAWDPGNDPRVLPAHAQAMRRLGYRAFLGVPARIGDRVVGVLNLLTCRPEGFTPEDVQIASAFAAHAAVVIENNRLLHETQRAYEELTQTQGQLEQVQKMEAIGRLAGGVAHDFNNLLTVILGRAELTRAQLRPEDPLHRNVDLIHRTAGRAAELTRQLLAFSRKQVLEPVVLDLSAVTMDMRDMLRRMIGEDITLVTTLDPGLGCVQADRGQIEQVILNLVVNARDAMPHGGRLTLETRNVLLGAPEARRLPGIRPGPAVILAVSDTGVGIPREILDRAFEPFFTTKEPGKGTGLGLAMVYGIVKQSGGDIEVESTPGAGTTFRVYLPLVDAAAPAAEREPGAAAARGSETILLVEDEEAVRELARDILEVNGYTVLEATNAGEALLACERHPGPIHLMLTDVVMPRFGGPELAERLTPTRPEMRVLYMSGYTDDAIVRQGALTPDSALVQKPFTPAVLARRVRERLDGGARPGEAAPAARA